MLVKFTWFHVNIHQHCNCKIDVRQIVTTIWFFKLLDFSSKVEMWRSQNLPVGLPYIFKVMSVCSDIYKDLYQVCIGNMEVLPLKKLKNYHQKSHNWPNLFSALPKTAQSAQIVVNQYVLFDVSYTWYKSSDLYL